MSILSPKSARTKTKAALPNPVLAVRQLLDRVPGWYTPHRWSDAGGLYATDTDAWLYRELPLTVLRPTANGTAPLDSLLRQLTDLGEGRDIHLVMHAWEEQAQAPAGTPGELREYLAGALTFFVPTRRLLIGVKLAKSAAAATKESKPLRSAITILDQLLGEHVPSFEAWDLDRANVEAVLDAVGARVPSSNAAAHLESWYTLGANTDVYADERDDVIALDEASVVELVAVASVDKSAAGDGHALMSAGRRGAAVASVRGTLTGKAGRKTQREDTSSTLSKVSVVFGRRSEKIRSPWTVTLRRFGGLEQRPLPMRQLDGLDETLPCSHKRLSPVLNRVGSAELQRVGFADTVAVGDDLGAFMGLASPNFSYPFFLNPAAPAAPVTLVTGAAGSGKTFTAENLAVQCALAGQRILYVTTGHDGGAGVRDLVGAFDLPVTEPGVFDPFRYLPAAAAAPLAEAALAALVPDLTAEDRRDLASGFQRATAIGQAGFDQVFAVTDGDTAVAKVKQAARRSALVASVVSTGPVGPAQFGPVTVLDLSWFIPLKNELPRPGHTSSQAAALLDIIVSLLVTHTQSSPHPEGTLVVVDGAGAVLSSPLTHAALTQAPRSGAAVHVLATTARTAEAATSPLAAVAGRVLVLAEQDEMAATAALSLVGMPVDASRREWLAAAGPHVDFGVVRRPALGIHRDSSGRRASVLIGPVPVRALPALTRGNASSYVTEL